MRKYDYESQKEYFIANSPPTPSECYDFEVPQRIAQSPKPTAAKLFNDLEKIFFDDENMNKVKLNEITRADSSCAYSFWENESLNSEKNAKKGFKSKEKVKVESSKKVELKSGKQVKRITSEQGKET